MIILRPTRALVSKFVGIRPAGLPPRFNTVAGECNRHGPEWDENHRQYVLQQLLPEVAPPLEVWHVCAEAYLTDVLFEGPLPASVPFTVERRYSFEEVLCDGSTVVPDLAYRWGRIKDPWSVGHDLLCLLNKYDLPDVRGTHWSRNAADAMYRRGWYAQGNYVIGSIWWAGLFLGSWIPWLKKADCKPECKTFHNDQLPLCKTCRHAYMVGKYNAELVCPACALQWDTGVGPGSTMVGSNWRAILRERK